MKKKEFVKVQKQINEKMNKYADRIIVSSIQVKRNLTEKKVRFGMIMKERSGHLRRE